MNLDVKKCERTMRLGVNIFAKKDVPWRAFETAIWASTGGANTRG